MMMNSARNTTYNAKREKRRSGEEAQKNAKGKWAEREAKARERDANYNIKHTYHDQESWEEDPDRPRHAKLRRNTHTNHQNYVSYCLVFKFVFKSTILSITKANPVSATATQSNINKHETQVS